MIQNLVFDMGPVRIRWQPELLIAHMALPEADRQMVLREVFRNVEWVRLDRGTIREEDALESICRRLPERLHPAARQLVLGWWQRPLIPVPGMAELIRELKEAGYGIYLLSNASLRLREYFPEIPGSEYFDGLLVSAEWKLLKPQHEIYEAFCRTFSLAPESCFFVADLPANVEGAMVAGMQGAVFHGDVPRLRRELQTAGISCHP